MQLDSITVNFLMESYHWALASVDFFLVLMYLFGCVGS